MYFVIWLLFLSKTILGYWKILSASKRSSLRQTVKWKPTEWKLILAWVGGRLASPQEPVRLSPQEHRQELERRRPGPNLIELFYRVIFHFGPIYAYASFTLLRHLRWRIISFRVLANISTHAWCFQIRCWAKEVLDQLFASPKLNFIMPNVTLLHQT